MAGTAPTPPRCSPCSVPIGGSSRPHCVRSGRGRRRRSGARCTAGPVFASGAGDSLAPVHAQTTLLGRPPVRGRGQIRRGIRLVGRASLDRARHRRDRAALETGNDDLLGSALFDDLQAGVVRRHRRRSRTRSARSWNAGALGAVMTGSGPTVVALARHLGQAGHAAAAVRARSSPAARRVRWARSPGSSNGRTRAFGAWNGVRSLPPEPEH